MASEFEKHQRLIFTRSAVIKIKSKPVQEPLSPGEVFELLNAPGGIGWDRARVLFKRDGNTPMGNIISYTAAMAGLRYTQTVEEEEPEDSLAADTKPKRARKPAAPKKPASPDEGLEKKPEAPKRTRVAAEKRRQEMFDQAADVAVRLKLKLPLKGTQLDALRSEGMPSYQTAWSNLRHLGKVIDLFNEGLAETIAARPPQPNIELKVLAVLQAADLERMDLGEVETEDFDESTLETVVVDEIDLPKIEVSESDVPASAPRIDTQVAKAVIPHIVYYPTPERDRVLFKVFELMCQRGMKNGLPTVREYARWAATDPGLPDSAELKKLFADAGPDNGWKNFLGFLSERTGVPLPEPKGQVINFPEAEPVLERSTTLSMA